MPRLLLLLLLLVPQPARAHQADMADVIIELRTRDLRVLAAAQSSVARESRALGAKEIAGLSHLPLLHLRIPADRLPRLAALSQVRAVYPNHRVTAARAEGGALIGSNQLRSKKYKASGKGIGVAVFDTGIDATHPELADRVVAGFDFIGDQPFADRNGHGTAVAGIVHGMAPDAHLLSFKVLDDRGNGTEWSVLEGLNEVYARHKELGIHVISASIVYGGPADEDCDAIIPESPAFDLLEEAGVLVVFAAGNDGFRNGISEFACHSKVIAAGAVYDADIGPSHHGHCDDPTTSAGQIACYSNSGNPLDVLAPAEVAWTTKSGGGYTGFGGTSAATPYVAGVLAQLRSKFPKASAAKIRSALTTTGTPLTDTNGLTRRLVSGPAAYKKLKKSR